MITMQIQGDLNWLAGRVHRIPSNMQAAALKWLERTTTHLAQRAKHNAPILTERLRLEIHPILPPVKMGDGFLGGVISPTDYAMEMHEHQKIGFMPAAPPGAQGLGDEPTETKHHGGTSLYGYGPITAQQPRTPEGGPGGKFITRTFNYHYQRYLQELGVAIRDAVVRDRVR